LRELFLQFVGVVPIPIAATPLASSTSGAVCVLHLLIKKLRRSALALFCQATESLDPPKAEEETLLARIVPPRMGKRSFPVRDAMSFATLAGDYVPGRNPVTIAISIKINDGLVLASDSASTVLGQTPDGHLHAVNVYNNAVKLFNLRKGLPIGAITWGSGSVGQASISTIVKDLRELFANGDQAHHGWKLDKENYTIETVANRLKEFVFDELYTPAFKDAPQKPQLGFIVAGYSAHAPMADEYQISINNGQCVGPVRLRSRDEIGMTWGGDPEALNRLIIGISAGLPVELQNLFKIPPAQLPQIMQVIQQKLQLPLVFPAMPLQDAIDLAEFLVDLTIKFSRFLPGAPTVGGPIEIAAISKHEGFRWINRKYYFNRELNPREVFTRISDPEP
jgi:hypothetical protein